jgi:hypothetical protein
MDIGPRNVVGRPAGFAHIALLPNMSAAAAGENCISMSGAAMSGWPFPMVRMLR